MTAPLEGIRVIDLTVVWSGPGSTALLGDLGAEVIRVEGNNRISRQASAKVTKESVAQTGYHASTFPDRDPGDRPYERTALFNWHSRNKLAACMNLETPEGHAAFMGLVAISDVLVENNTNGTLEKLGLGHQELLAANPRLIVARMPPLGMSGPMSNYLGYGPNFNSLVGIAAMDGYEDETPDTAGENYHMDEAAPAGLAFAVMAALWDREHTGKGGLVEFSQAENVMQEIGEFYLDLQMNDRVPGLLGNSDPHLLQDAFLTADEDRWVALSVRDNRDWAALLEVIGADTPTATWADPGWSAEQRSAAAGEIKAGIAAWAGTLPADQIVHRLQAVRVPSGEVMTELRLLEDRHLADRDWFKVRSMPSIGTYRYPGQPWRAEGFDTVFGRPVPPFGAENEYVYRKLLGYSAEEYADLTARGLITDEQFA